MSQLHVHLQQFQTMIPASPLATKEAAIEAFFTHLETHGCKVKSHCTVTIGEKVKLTVEAQVYEFH